MIGIQPYQLKQFHNAGFHIHLTAHLMDFKRLHENLFYRPSRIQTGGRVLKNNLRLFPHFLKFCTFQCCNILSFQINMSIRRFQKPDQCPSQSTFSTAAFAYNTEGLPPHNLKTDIVHGLYRTGTFIFSFKIYFYMVGFHQHLFFICCHKLSLLLFVRI